MADSISEVEQSIFRHTFLKRSEVSSFFNGEEAKNALSLKFVPRGHTIGNVIHDPKLDEVKEVETETYQRNSSVKNISDFDIQYQPIKVKEVKINYTHTIESELTEDNIDARLGSVKLSVMDSAN